MADMAQYPVATFDDATRQNIVPLTTFSYVAGGTTTFQLPTSGLGARLYLGVVGTVTGTPTVTTTGPWSLFKRITIRANSGVVLFDTTGYGAYLLMLTSSSGFDPGNFAQAQGASTATKQLLFNYSATAITFALEIPMCWNRRDDIGLVLLQNQRAQVTVQIVFNSVSGSDQSFPYTAGTTPAITATVSPFLEFFTLPAAPQLMPNLLIMHTVTEFGQSMTASGDQQVVLQRGNTYTRIIHYAYDAGSLATAAANFTKGVLRYDQNVRPYEVNYQAQLMEQNIKFERFLPDATWVWSLDWQGLAGLGYFRDTIDSESVSELTSILTYNATPGANSTLNTVAEQLIHLEPAAA